MSLLVVVWASWSALALTLVMVWMPVEGGRWRWRGVGNGVWRVIPPRRGACSHSS